MHQSLNSPAPRQQEFNKERNSEFGRTSSAEKPRLSPVVSMKTLHEREVNSQKNKEAKIARARGLLLTNDAIQNSVPVRWFIAAEFA